MFSYCEKLSNLDLSHFNIEKVTNIQGIFVGCKNDIISSNKSKFQKFNYEDMTEENYFLSLLSKYIK